MPNSGPKTVADRCEGTLSNVHPRRDGSLILQPEDIFEGRGDFVKTDASGNPEGLKIVRVENPDGWDVLVGTSPDVRQQNSAPLLITRPSFVDDQPFVANGPPAPSPNDEMLAKIPQAQTPLLKVVKALVHGFPEATAESPMWYQYCWVVGGGAATSSGVGVPMVPFASGVGVASMVSLTPGAMRGTLTTPSPPVPFQLAFGQGAEVGWADPPQGVSGVALFLSEPGTSSATNPGPMREQERLFFSSYKLKTRKLTGPYRNGRLAPTTNETILIAPNPPPDTEKTDGNYVTVEPGGYILNGDYHFYISVAGGQGETPATLVYHAEVLDGPVTVPAP